MSNNFTIKIEYLSRERFTEMRCLIVFTDLTNFTITAQNLDDWSLAALVQQYYQRTVEIITNAGGRVVKFIGDATLIIFPAELAENGILTMRRYQTEIDQWLIDVGYSGRVIIKAHLGNIIAGKFGQGDSQWFDIIGADVNHTAVLASKGLAITEQAFAALADDARKHFKLNSSNNYIPIEEENH